VTSDIFLEFKRSDQSQTALRAAAYRLIGEGSCLIESTEIGFRCIITPTARRGKSAGDLRARFLDLVTDENLREQIAAQTEPTRNLILALAFGALAEKADHTNTD
jgi:His-Xaa-Ser system protein HxsD